jgi:hypothetical protein
MLAAAVALPLTIGPDLTPSTTEPAAWLFALLVARVGAPFFALAATAPLVQRWLSYTRHPHAADPYFLYAASNTGSLLALLAYPVVVEPWLPLDMQSRAWAAGYWLLVLLMVTVAIAAWHQRAAVPAFKAGPRGEGRGTEPQAQASVERLTARRRLRWIALAAVPASLMLGVTTHLTTDVAAVPLLWILPLSLYLLTFVLAFARRPPLPHHLMCVLLAVLVLVPLLTISLHLVASWWALMLAHLLTLFVAAMVCHGELARDRPSVGRLTEFYLWLSVGGAAGGLFNALIAPLVFRTVIEYPLALLAACLLRPDAIGIVREPGGLARDFTWAVAALAVAVAGAWTGTRLGLPHGYAVGLAIPVVAAMTQWPRARRYALLLSAAFLAVQIQPPPADRILAIHRGFFGVIKVTEVSGGKYRALMHGNILHGLEPVDPSSRQRLVSYYGPVAEVLGARRAGRGAGLARVGVVGLGIGTVIAGGRPDERWRFFEIDPAVVSFARNPSYFRYLSETRVPHDVIVGEGRLALMREPSQSFDVLLLDAFTSDAIPMHLMTREAVAMYVDKLVPAGLLLVNISNRYVELAPVLGAIAADLGMDGRWRSFVPSDAESDAGLLMSTWAVLARNADALGAVAGDDRWHRLPDTGLRVWTDNYSSLMAVIKWTTR